MWGRVQIVWLFWAVVGVEAAQGRKLHVLTSILPVYCFAAQVAGDGAEVENLLPGGVGPHDYQFSPGDLRKVNRADLIIINGLGLESWLEKVFESGGGKGKRVIEAARGLDSQLIREPAKLPGWEGPRRGVAGVAGANSHIWLDPRLAAHALSNILSALRQADPGRASLYEANAGRYLERLRVLDCDLERGLNPVRGRAFVTYHDAFAYWVRRYGLNLVGVVEQVPEVDPSQAYLAALLKVIREQGVKVVFTEPQFSSKLIRQLARDAGVAVAELDPLETGVLDPDSYERGMRRNLKTMLEFLK